jgi:hypothetical protein
MNVAFITVLNLDDLSNLPDVAAEISDDLSNSGFEVVSVQPWARPSLGQTPINVPTINPQPTNQQTNT